MNERQMESLAEGALEECRRKSLPLREVVRQLCAGAEVKRLVTPAELLRAARDLQRERRIHEAFGEEIPVDPREGVMENRAMENGKEEEEEEERDPARLGEMVRYLGGDLVRARVVWKTAKSYTLRQGERAEYCREGGEGWLVCAVRILQGEKLVRLFPEMRIKRRRPAGWMGTRGETLVMQCMTLDCEGIDQEKILTRFAAVMQMHCEGSGLKSAAHVARLTGRTRAAGAAQRAVLVRTYYERTGGAAGFTGVSSAPRLKAAAERRKARGAENG